MATLSASLTPGAARMSSTAVVVHGYGKSVPTINWPAPTSAARCRTTPLRLQIIDARPRHYTTRSSDIMDGAVWRDPERVDEWIGERKPDQPVVTYCVYGFHIGCQTAIALRAKGFDARYMAGGHYAWKAMGGKVKLLEQ